MTKSILCIVSEAFGSTGGIAKFNRDLVTAITENPLEYNVVLIPKRIGQIGASTPNRVQHVRGGVQGILAFLYCVLIASVRARQNSLVICGHINLSPFAVLAGYLTRAPVWCVLHGIDAWRKPSRWVTRRALRRIDKYLVVSSVTRDRFCTWSGVSANACHILPNSIDLTVFSPAAKPEYLITRYKLEGRRVLLTVGRMDSEIRKKGFDAVIDALLLIRQRLPDIVYLVGGDGPDKSRLEAKVRNLGLQDMVRFTGFIAEKEKVDHYRVADAYVMPSEGEGFGIVFLEALACGVPVVGSWRDGGRDALKDGILGELVDPRSPMDVANGVLRALSGERGVIKKDLEDFAWPRFQERVRNLLKTECHP